MTGFGRAVLGADDGGERLEVEVRSVNHRGLKVVARLPDRLSSFAPDVEGVVRTRLERGSVLVSIEHRSPEAEVGYRVNRAVVRRYGRDLEELRVELGLAAPIAVERLAALPGAIEMGPADERDPDAMRGRLREGVLRALEVLDESRRVEGAQLAADLKGRRAAIAERMAAVRGRIPATLDEYRRRLTERIEALLRGTGVAPLEADLLREVAHFADRTDISEEVARLESHLGQLDSALEESGPVGRKLDFLAQEMLREANTMGSKTQDSSLVKDVIAIKLEVDKIREQVQNVE